VFPDPCDGAFPLVPGSFKVRTDWLGLGMEVTEASVLMLPFSASSVGVARRRLVCDLIAAGIYDSAACDAALVISELLSNALRHAGPLPGAKIRVAWRIDADCVQISVRDGGGQTRPELGEPTQAATGGRGLRIVEKLSKSWGTSPDEAGSTVWAQVPVRQVTPDQVTPDQLTTDRVTTDRVTTEMTTVGGSAAATESG
jgi:anti-sigma regulatory factor (Ser/Thr protein kinase)